MSLFLGPIHYWLYNKIKLQHELTEQIIALKPDLLQKKLGTLELKPLEEVIDTTNIHGWLQEKVSLCEERLAKAVTILVNKDAHNLELIEALFYNKGKEITQNYFQLSTAEFYKLLNDTLLDGMPCDHAYSVLEESESRIVLQRNTCVHKEYWDKVQGNIKLYYQLRDKLIEGMAERKGITYRFNGTDSYTIERIV